MNPFMIMGQMMKNGGNPQQMIMSMLQQNNNPMTKNMINMMQNNDANGIEQMARNLCKENGISPEQAISSAKKFFGM